jgi:hypothetical protein
VRDTSSCVWICVDVWVWDVGRVMAVCGSPACMLLHSRKLLDASSVVGQAAALRAQLRLAMARAGLSMCTIMLTARQPTPLVAG